MIKKGIIKSDQVVFIYSQPPEEALIGIVENISYPIILVHVIPRNGVDNKFGKYQEIDISKNMSLTIMTDELIKKYMTAKEKKILIKFRKENETVDLFAGEY